MCAVQIDWQTTISHQKSHSLVWHHKTTFPTLFLQKLEDLIRDRDKLNHELERRAQEVEKVNKSHEENALKRDKAIQGLAAALHKREKEVGP